MYKAKLWDEDKWDIHSESYSHSKYGSNSHSDKKDDKKYHEKKYGSEGKDPSSDYMKKEEKSKEDKEKNPSHFDELVEEEKKDGGQKAEEEEITFKAAKQIFNEARFEQKKEMPKKDDKTIEDAIKKAVEEEKKVIVMD
jgi:hypothetical protein